MLYSPVLGLVNKVDITPLDGFGETWCRFEDDQSRVFAILAELDCSNRVSGPGLVYVLSYVIVVLCTSTRITDAKRYRTAPVKDSGLLCEQLEAISGDVVLFISKVKKSLNHSFASICLPDEILSVVFWHHNTMITYLNEFFLVAHM